jgi:hypothetical protein
LIRRLYPANLISITDTGIVSYIGRFHEGQKPAVDVGTSVNQVGDQISRQLAKLRASKRLVWQARFPQESLNSPRGKLRVSLSATRSLQLMFIIVTLPAANYRR